MSEQNGLTAASAFRHFVNNVVHVLPIQIKDMIRFMQTRAPRSKGDERMDFHCSIIVKHFVWSEMGKLNFRLLTANRVPYDQGMSERYGYCALFLFVSAVEFNTTSLSWQSVRLSNGMTNERNKYLPKQIEHETLTFHLFVIWTRFDAWRTCKHSSLLSYSSLWLYFDSHNPTRGDKLQS